MEEPKVPPPKEHAPEPSSVPPDVESPSASPAVAAPSKAVRALKAAATVLVVAGVLTFMAMVSRLFSAGEPDAPPPESLPPATRGAETPGSDDAGLGPTTRDIERYLGVPNGYDAADDPFERYRRDGGWRRDAH